MNKQGRFAATEVIQEPIINARKEQSFAANLDAARTVYKIVSSFIKQPVTVFGSEGFRLQVRATQAGTVDSIVDAVVLPDRP